MLLLAGLALVPVIAAADRRALLRHAVHAHPDLRAGGDGAEPDPRLRRDGELRPRDVHRHRRLRGGHPVVPRRRTTAGCSCAAALGVGAVVALVIGLDLPAHQRHGLHHDHAGLRADALLPGDQPASSTAATTACTIAARSDFGLFSLASNAALYYVAFGAAGRVPVRLLAARPFALRHGAARLPQQRAAHGRAGLSDAALQAHRLRDLGAGVRASPACCSPT